jgi:hypothetical protein
MKLLLVRACMMFDFMMFSLEHAYTSHHCYTSTNYTAKLATKLKNKQRKGSQQQKDLLEIEKELKEGDASIDKIDLAKNQSDMLHCVTVSYFRILKDCCVTVGTDSEKSDGHGKNKKSGSGGIVDDLLPVCLRGLAKFSHLIHVDGRYL